MSHMELEWPKEESTVQSGIFETRNIGVQADPLAFPDCTLFLPLYDVCSGKYPTGRPMEWVVWY